MLCLIFKKVMYSYMIKNSNNSFSGNQNKMLCFVLFGTWMLTAEDHIVTNYLWIYMRFLHLLSPLLSTPILQRFLTAQPGLIKSDTSFFCLFNSVLKMKQLKHLRSTYEGSTIKHSLYA